MRKLLIMLCAVLCCQVLLAEEYHLQVGALQASLKPGENWFTQ